MKSRRVNGKGKGRGRFDAKRLAKWAKKGEGPRKRPRRFALDCKAGMDGEGATVACSCTNSEEGRKG